MQQSSAVDALLFAAGLGRLTKQAFSSLSMEEFLGLSMRVNREAGAYAGSGHEDIPAADGSTRVRPPRGPRSPVRCDQKLINRLSQDLGHYLGDPADKNVVFALLRRLRAELASQGAAEADDPAGVGMESRKQPLHSQEDLLDLDEHDGDLLEVRACVRAVEMRSTGAGSAAQGVRVDQ
jgi:hypothetical protein